MLYKKTIIVWSDDVQDLEAAVRSAVDAAENANGEIVAYGVAQPSYIVADPEADPDFDDSVAEVFALARKWYTGKTDGSLYPSVQHASKAAAEAWITEQSRTDPLGVARGDYFLDPPNDE